MIPLFIFFAAGGIAVAGHKTAAKPIDRTLGSSSIVFYIKVCSGTPDFPRSGPILTSGTIFTIRFILIWHLLLYPKLYLPLQSYDFYLIFLTGVKHPILIDTPPPPYQKVQNRTDFHHRRRHSNSHRHSYRHRLLENIPQRH